MAIRKNRQFPRRTALAAAILSLFGSGAAIAATPGAPLGPVQNTGLGSPELARNAAGDMVGLSGVSVRQFNSDGTPKGAVFSASATPLDPYVQLNTAVAMDDAGDFVVAWLDDTVPGNKATHSVFARRFGANGVAKGDAVQVSGALKNPITDVSVGMDNDGDFAVLWRQEELYADHRLCDSGYSVLCNPVGLNTATLEARRYTAGGTKAGAPFVVAAGLQVELMLVLPDVFKPESAKLAMNRSGAFSVVWNDASGSGTNGLHLRRYNAAGLPNGVGQLISATSTDACAPGVAMDDAGDTVVAYCKEASLLAGGSLLYTRVYGSLGLPATGEVRVDQGIGGNSSGNIGWPLVSTDRAGDFVISWAEYIGFDQGIRAQRFAHGATPLGQNFWVVPQLADFPSGVASDGVGNFAIAWSGQLQTYAGP